tara:strand:+ start:520 stop:633 length:114 start_codon:yes stop_codon:yes gene_type:complete
MLDENGLLEEIDIKDLSKTQRINLLKVCVPYLGGFGF